MLKVSAETSVFRDRGPLVVEHPCSGPPNVNHWLDGEDHAFAQSLPVSTGPEIRNLRIFVQFRSDTVSDKLADYAESGGFHVFLNCRANIANRVADHGFGDSL